MLTIREEQIEILRRSPRVRFENRLIDHCFRQYPRECEALGESQTREVIRLGLDLSLGQGYRTQREVAYFVSLMFPLGSFFCWDPQLPWFGEGPLSERAGPIRALYRRAMNYLDDTAGEDNEFLVRALIRIRDFDLGEIPELAGSAREDFLCELLERFYPQKYQYQGEGLNRGLVRYGAEVSCSHGIKDSRGITVFVTLIFMMGSQFYRDPIFPWALQVLDDPGLAWSGARGQRLHEAAIEHLEESLVSGENR